MVNHRAIPGPAATPAAGNRGAVPQPGSPRAASIAAAPAKQTAQAAASRAWEIRLGKLEETIEQFRIDSERFWNGGLAIPPEELRTKIQRELRELRGASNRPSSDQFRMGGLEARFNSLSELFGRRLREREEGRGVPLPRIVVVPATHHDPRAGILLSGVPDRAAVEALWSGLAAAGGGAKLDLESLRTYLQKQLVDIRLKTGAEAVVFRVVQEEGKLKLKAKPVGKGS